MPITNGTYVNPGWKNGGPPALNAVELNAISDTLAEAQAKNISQDALIAALQTAVGGSAKIEVGSYVGTGTYGADNPNSITFSFAPKLVIVSSENGLAFNSNRSTGNFWDESFIWLQNSNRIQTTYNKANATCTCTLSGKTLSWYTDSASSTYESYLAQSQVNTSGKLYYWLAIG